MSVRTPLHHNSGDKPWTKRASEVIDLWVTMAAMNPKGFRTPRENLGRGAPPKTRLDRIYDLEQKLA